jgi:hypothetical protein
MKNQGNGIMKPPKSRKWDKKRKKEENGIRQNQT